MRALRIAKWIVAAIAVLVPSGCSNVTPVSGPVNDDLFDRFEVRTMLDSAALPASPTALFFLAGAQELVIFGSAGNVAHYRLEADSTFQFLGNLIIPEPGTAGPGITDVAPDPRFPAIPYIYYSYTTPNGRLDRIARLRWSATYGATLQSRQQVLELDRVFPASAANGIGGLCFAQDGTLYILTGDATQPRLSQDPAVAAGKILRILPNAGLQAGYGIPVDNPYLRVSGVMQEIAAFGLHRPSKPVPWRDQVFFADAGSDRADEINLYGLGAADFGWPDCEGDCADSNVEKPILTIEHTDRSFQTIDPQRNGAQSRSLSLGLFYVGEGTDPYADLLDGHLLFTDQIQGFVRAMFVGPGGAVLESQHIFHLESIADLVEGPDGFIYGITKDRPQLFRVEWKGKLQ